VFKSQTLSTNIEQHGLDLNQITEKYTQTLNPSSQIYFSINKYCDIYNVPKKIAFNVATLETGWKGPKKSNKYNPHQISTAEAYGPMQVLHSTALDVWKDDSIVVKTITKNRLLNDIDFNVHTSIRYLRYLHDRYGDWTIVLGYYNTGYPKINEYAMKGTK
jgi:soluble lytic murein transglycosylase-like protein